MPAAADGAWTGWSLAGRGLVLALAARASYLLIRYEAGMAVHRYQVESAALMLVVVGLFILLSRKEWEATTPRPKAGGSFLAWAIFCILAMLLYAPALSVGFLSDDVGLADHAMRWHFGPLTPELFRPVPLFVWSLILHAGGGALALHLVNVALHGTNAYLTTRVIAAYVDEPRWSWLAGLLVLTAPLAPEAVVWNAGVFDVMMTTFLLSSVVVAHRYGARPSALRRLLFVTLGIVALLSKETAAVGPALLLLDAWIRRDRSRALRLDIGLLLGLTALVSIYRLTVRFGIVTPPITKYVVQRTLFGAFGSLAVPWHADLGRALPVFALTSGLAVIGLVTMFVIAPGRPQARRTALGAAAWIIVSILPVFPVLFIPPDLQESRYLYLASPGWAALLVAMATASAGLGSAVGQASPVCLMIVILLNASGTRVHLRHWVQAATLRDAVLRAAQTDERMRACPTVTIHDLPDAVAGAYVFRNGAREVFARQAGLDISVGPSVGPCAFRWDDSWARFVSASPAGR